MPPLRASLIADFTPEIGADTLVTIQASAAGELCALFAVNSEDLRPSGRRRAQPEPDTRR